jgi:hypothetical protein
MVDERVPGRLMVLLDVVVASDRLVFLTDCIADLPKHHFFHLFYS